MYFVILLQKNKSASKILNMGADLFIEKPLLDNFLDSKKIFKKSLKSKSKIFIGYNLRYFESLIKFKKLIEKNSCGKIISFRSEVGSYLPEWKIRKIMKTMYLQIKI